MTETINHRSPSNNKKVFIANIKYHEELLENPKKNNENGSNHMFLCVNIKIIRAKCRSLASSIHSSKTAQKIETIDIKLFVANFNRNTLLYNQKIVKALH